MFAGLKRVDLIPVLETAVPVSVTQQWASVGLLNIVSPKDTSIGDLALISFFYILRVG